jgi:Na+/proline symporter
VSWVFVALIAYVSAQFAIGVWLSKRIATDTDYILAGRRLGPLLVAFSVFATFFGAEAIVATSGAVYEQGIAGATVDPFGYGAALLIVGLIFAGPLWRRGLVTFADLFRQRYSPGVEKLLVFILLPGSLFWAAAQIRAFGQVLAGNSELGVTTAIILAALLIGGYSIVGGLLADSVTDLIQGTILIAGLAILVVVLAMSAPAAPEAATTAQAASAGAAEPKGVLAFIESLLVPICGTVVSVEIISRFLGSRSASVAKVGTSSGAVLYVLVGLLPIALGLIGQRLLPGIEQSEQIVPRLAEAYLPGILRIALAGALVSAILSAVHSILHGSAAQVSQNVIARAVPGLGPVQRLWTVRATVLALTLTAFFIALTTDRIKELVETASAFGSAGVFVAIVFGLFTRFGGPASAYAALITGTAVWALGRYVAEVETPYMIALAASFTAYVVFAVVEAAMSRRKMKEIAL